MRSDAIKKGISRAPARAMLKAMGLNDDDRGSALRISLGRGSGQDALVNAAGEIVEKALELREKNPRWDTMTASSP